VEGAGEGAHGEALGAVVFEELAGFAEHLGVGDTRGVGHA
jgi:hypothetical protein